MGAMARPIKNANNIDGNSAWALRINELIISSGISLGGAIS